MVEMQAVYRPYYTKSNILVNYMVDMLDAESGMRIFEPCAGDGVFIDALTQKIPDMHIDANELNPDAFSLLQRKYAHNELVSVKNSDTLFDEALQFYAGMGGLYDRIIANPPYGGWQEYERRKDLKSIYSGLYVKETYTLFLYRCIQLLVDKGKLVFIVPQTFLNLHRHTSLRAYLLTHTKIKEIILFPSSFFPDVHFGYSNLSIITLEKSESRDACLSNDFQVLTGFKWVEDINKTGEKNSKKYHFLQGDVYNHADHALFVSDQSVTTHLNTCGQRVGDIADCVTGIYSGNDKKYLHPLSQSVKNGKMYVPVAVNRKCSNTTCIANILEGIEGPECFVPVVKGGAIKYVKPDIWFIDWSIEAVKAYKTDRKARFQNSGYYFKDGIGIPMVSSSQVTAALIEKRVFDQSIVGVFPKDQKWLYYLLAFFNSPTCNILLRTINPSANNSANYIKKLPFIEPEEEVLAVINALMKNIIADLKQYGVSNLEHEAMVNKLISNLYGL